MKKFLVLLALSALAVPSISRADGWVWKSLRFPAVGAYGGNGAYGDTAFFSMTSATGTATLYHNNAGTQDTSKAFTLENWVPAPTVWATIDTTYATSGTLGTAAAQAKAAYVRADTIFCFTLAVGPLTSIAQTGETGDSIFVVLEASVDGQIWVQLGGAQGQGVVELLSSNSWFYSYSTSAAIRPTQGAPQIMFWPLLRVRIIGDISGSNTGQFVAKVGYFAGTPPGTAAPTGIGR